MVLNLLWVIVSFENTMNTTELLPGKMHMGTQFIDTHPQDLTIISGTKRHREAHADVTPWGHGHLVKTSSLDGF